MTGEARDLVLFLGAADRDEEDMARFTTLLQNELRELDVEQVDKVQLDDAPEGARAGAIEALGVLLVKFGPALTSAVVRTVRSWLSKDSSRTAELLWNGNRITLSGVSSEDQERLIKSWIRLVEQGQVG